MGFSVLFDMDGVIVDTNPWHLISLYEFCTAKGIDLEENYIKAHIFGRANHEWIAEIFPKLNAQQILEYGLEKELMFRQIFQPHLLPVKGLTGFLKELKRNSIKIALATSAPMVNVDFVLNGLGISSYFDSVVNATPDEKGKPHPDIFLKAARSISSRPDQCVVIEDSIAGIQAGIDAGCKVIGITTTHTRDELDSTDLVIENFQQLNIKVLSLLFENA